MPNYGFDIFLKSCDAFPVQGCNVVLILEIRMMTMRLAELLVIIKRLLNLSHGPRDLKREREIYIVTYLKTLLRGDLRKYRKKLTNLHAGESIFFLENSFSCCLESKINHAISYQHKGSQNQGMGGGGSRICKEFLNFPVTFYGG